MKTVVIPGDFSVETMQVAQLFTRNAHEEFSIVFTHLFHVTDDIQDLLFSTYRKKEYDFVSEAFWRDCHILKDLYGNKLKSIKVEFFYGNKLAAFKNFLDAQNADFIAYSETFGIPKLCKSSLDALPVIKKAGIPLIDTDLLEEPAKAQEICF
ncbi:hypothetical protein [Dyadobacter sp. CY326]|uniref:hypothetical protein n=1 Tax=Dyadobacter sp. CY326 TaxID=2907300 RepID=UPI001F402C2F|nr:hypothetical protein [Dyadobacter sp. CY326]MCE7065358.1 hypothetical protein [Dyadobacter sp. CY326]